ncbi:hypothetical protein J4401_04145 [Candidatus Woesearchaeota archaeon]|nr:hypothetical protein [Candidatus Woesearchaeota archaeon]
MKKYYLILLIFSVLVALGCTRQTFTDKVAVEQDIRDNSIDEREIKEKSESNENLVNPDNQENSSEAVPFSPPLPENNEEKVIRQYRESPEIPSEKESAGLPSCENAIFTVAPVELGNVYDITPLGNIGPPGHTFPTEHTHIHLTSGGSSSRLYDLFAPTDVYITSISRGIGYTQDPEDYTIYFALCKDVIGYYNHVKSLSPDMQKIFSSGNCRQNPGDNKYTYCENNLNFIKAGSVMGNVGRMQGNFDFGLIDIRKSNKFVNPSRYGIRSLHIQCPFEYYPMDMRNKFFDIIKRNDDEQCGTVMQDVPGSLQGNWFLGDARADNGMDWDKHLAFVSDPLEPSFKIVSIGGTFTEAGEWKFKPIISGQTNRIFSDVKADENIYCYEGMEQNGKVLVQMTSSNELKIERLDGRCSGNNAFRNPTLYSR